MESLFSQYREKRKKNARRWFALVYSTLALIGASSLILYLLTKGGEDRPVEFDVGACVRMMDVSTVYRITPDPATQSVWFGTREGLRVFDRRNSRWIRYGLDHGLPSEEVYDIAFAGEIPWVGTGGGCAFFDPREERFRPFTSISSSQVFSIEYLGDEIFAASDSAGLFRIRPGSDSATRVTIPGLDKTSHITCLRAVGEDLYVGLRGGRLFAYSPATGAWRKFIFGEPIPVSTYLWDVIAFGGILWVATSERGVWTGPLGADTLQIDADFPAKGAFTFEPSGDGLWSGTPWGLFRYHEKQKVWIKFAHPEERKSGEFRVISLADSPDTLWFGAEALGLGLFRKKNVDWQAARPGLGQSNVAALMAFGGSLWTGYGYQGGGLDRFDAASLQYTGHYDGQAGVPETNIQAFAAREPLLFYGGFTGFGYVDASGKNYGHFVHREGYSLNDVAAILPDPDSALIYLASHSGVVRFFPENDSFAPYPATLPYRATALCVVGTHLWFGTLSHGVGSVDRRTGTVESFILSDAGRITGFAAADAAGKASTMIVATRDQGCFMVSEDGRRADPFPLPAPLLKDHSDESTALTAVRRIGKTVWLGTRAAGCLIYDIQSARWTALSTADGLVNRRIRSLHDDSLHVWVGCFGGVSRYEKEYIGKKLGVEL